MAKAKELKEEVYKHPELKPTVKAVQMHAAPDMIGAKQSISSKNADIYEMPNSLLIVSKGTNRKVVIPFANVRAYELL